MLVEIQEELLQSFIRGDISCVVGYREVHTAGKDDFIIVHHQCQVGQQIIHGRTAGTGGGIIDPGVNDDTGHILVAITDGPAAAKGAADLVGTGSQSYKSL